MQSTASNHTDTQPKKDFGQTHTNAHKDAMYYVCKNKSYDL